MRVPDLLNFSPRWLLIGAVVSIAYSILIFGTVPKLESDADMFWNAAQEFRQDGLWKALTENANAREPVYPLFLYAVESTVGVELAPRTAVVLQLGMLLLCAVMVSRLLLRWTTSSAWSTGVFLMVAFSPGLLNSALSLYSESIATCLFTGWVFAFAQAVDAKASFDGWGWMLVSAMLGSLLILSRAAYLHIAGLSFIGWTILLMAWSKSRKKRLVPKLAVYAVVLLSGPFIWMARNARVSGFYSMANHAGVVISGRYQRSLERYTLRDVLAGTLNAASESACRAVFKNCERYSWSTANSQGYLAWGQLKARAHLDSAQTDRQLFSDTIKAIVTQHPFRFIAFGWYEVVQLSFFETLATGAADFKYAWLGCMAGNALLRGLVHVFLPLLYAAGFVLFLWHELAQKKPNREISLAAFLAAVPVVGHFLIYSTATTVLRYSFVIAPIYIALAFFGWSETLSSKEMKNT